MKENSRNKSHVNQERAEMHLLDEMSSTVHSNPFPRQYVFLLTAMIWGGFKANIQVTWPAYILMQASVSLAFIAALRPEKLCPTGIPVSRSLG